MTRTRCNSYMALNALTPAETVEMLEAVKEHYQAALLCTTRQLWYEADDAQTRAEAALYRLTTDAQARG